MSERVKHGNLQVSHELDSFLKNEVLPGIDVEADSFWSAFEKILQEFGGRNKALLDKRKEIQKQIDEWHISRKGEPHNQDEYIEFLRKIDYLIDEGEDFEITTTNVDSEIREVAGAQLVVPVMNARFSLNAANARWGSLYDALYGTDMISEEGGAERSGPYNPARGDKVIEFSKDFLDESVPLQSGNYKDVTGFKVENGDLVIAFSDQSSGSLSDKSQFIGYKGDPDNPASILFKNNNLHIDIQIDPEDSIGKDDPANIKDVVLESAVTTIQDLEDSVAAVDAEDKSLAYRNWLGLMKGDLKETFVKGDKEMTRSLNGDRSYTGKDDSEITLPGRSVLLVRNVGHLMTNPAILDVDGNEVPEGIMDAMFTICIAKHDLQKEGKSANSRTGSIYIVKPKMHGPEEVQFTCDLFERVEEVLGLDRLTVKIGIMDEERRTTVNLKECIRVAKDRVIFINTGFLDRTGDEIHTSMEAGPMVTKTKMKQENWINAYENWNVDIGLETGFKGNAQIGKGMWPMPDEMLEMYKAKSVHPRSGANCAWVPSPTAATIHAIHYHQIYVQSEQDKILNRDKASLNDLLKIPLIKSYEMPSAEEIQEELDNNAQGILGYVVRWVDQGIGCSKVPDLNDIGLMEDRATCRISSQHIANWLHHGLCSEKQVIETMKKMAKVVDLQNKDDVNYKKMSPAYDGIAFKAACDLAIQGRTQPSGYTEPILHEMRLKRK